MKLEQYKFQIIIYYYFAICDNVNDDCANRQNLTYIEEIIGYGRCALSRGRLSNAQESIFHRVNPYIIKLI